MQHAINLITYELKSQIEAEVRKSKVLADTKRRYDEMCAKHARELKPLIDSLARDESGLPSDSLHSPTNKRGLMHFPLAVGYPEPYSYEYEQQRIQDGS